MRFTHMGREYRQAAGDTKKEAQALLGQRLKEIKVDSHREKLGLSKESRITFRELTPRFVEWAKIHKRSWQRDVQSLGYLVPVFGEMRLQEITKARVEAYQRDRLNTPSMRGTPMSPPSVNREVACLRKVLSYAVEIGELEVNHLLRVRMLPEAPARKPVLEVEDEARLLQAIPSDWLRFLVRIALGSGLRQMEALSLRWRSVDFGSCTFTVEDSKSGDSRTVAFHPSLLEELTRRRGLPDGYVVTLPSGKVPDQHSVTFMFKRAARKAGLGHLRYHDTRHIAAQRLLEAGASLPELAQWLGHKSLDMVQRYTNPNPKRLRSLVAGMVTCPREPSLAKENRREP